MLLVSSDLCLKTHFVQKSVEKFLSGGWKVLILQSKFLRNREMYAVVEILGQQFKVEKGTKLFVNRMASEEGSSVKLDRVLLVDNEGSVKVGAPVVENASVSAKVIKHCKGETVLVFKKKRRKGYQTLNGHRQALTQIEIESINA